MQSLPTQKGEFLGKGAVRETRKTYAIATRAAAPLRVERREQAGGLAAQHAPLRTPFRSPGILQQQPSDTEEQVFPGDGEAGESSKTLVTVLCWRPTLEAGRKFHVSALSFHCSTYNLPEALGRGKNWKHWWNRVESGPGWGFTRGSILSFGAECAWGTEVWLLGLCDRGLSCCLGHFTPLLPKSIITRVADGWKVAKSCSKSTRWKSGAVSGFFHLGNCLKVAILEASWGRDFCLPRIRSCMKLESQ